MKKFIKTIIYSLVAVLPAVTNAQGLLTGDANGVLSWLLVTLNNVVMPLIITGMVVMFLYGVFKKMFGEKAEEGTKFMIWGIVGLTVALTIFGFVGFFKRTLFGTGPVDPANSGGITPCVYDTNGPQPGC